jgi:hypothetical protein
MNNPLTESHIALSINIFDQTQHALIRKHLTVERLISDILREFAQELDLNRKYILIYDGRQLDPELVMGDANFDAERELVFAYYEPVRSGNTIGPSTSALTLKDIEALDPGKLLIAVLQEVETGQEFLLRKNPSIIGRSNMGNGAEEGIDIDLFSFREGRTVSRPHAKLSQSGHKYFFEGLKEQRPVFVNDKLLPFGQKHTLQNGDMIGIGKVRFKFQLR